MYISLKDLIFQLLDSLCHITELYKVLNNTNENKPYLFLYTDDGPDHQVTYVHINSIIFEARFRFVNCY